MATAIMRQKMNASCKWFCEERKCMTEMVGYLWVEMESHRSIASASNDARRSINQKESVNKVVQPVLHRTRQMWPEGADEDPGVSWNQVLQTWRQ